MLQYIKREKCPITDTNDYEVLSSKPYPLFAGCMDDANKDLDLVPIQEWVIFKESGVIALSKLIPLEILYKNGHDAGAIGDLWEEHHREFAKFIVKFSPNSILEIGGGHGKLSLEVFKNTDINSKPKWTIIEPNSTSKNEGVEYIDGFFGKQELIGEFDCIVHSHTFEHIYQPHSFLQYCCKSLVGGGYMIFTLPNMQKWLENKWTNCLNFEHTIFLTEEVIEFLLAKNSFKILEKKYFKDHSVFYAAQKVENGNIKDIFLGNEFEKNKQMFKQMQKYYESAIDGLNQIFKETSKNIYLFGAHLFSQYLLYNGLDSSKVVAILDNNPNKQGKRLYGTNFRVYSPKILKDCDISLVVLCAGAYNNEIKKDILENINNNVEIVCF